MNESWNWTNSQSPKTVSISVKPRKISFLQNRTKNGSSVTSDCFLPQYQNQQAEGSATSKVILPPRLLSLLQPLSFQPYYILLSRSSQPSSISAASLPGCQTGPTIRPASWASTDKGYVTHVFVLRIYIYIYFCSEENFRTLLCLKLRYKI